MTKNRETHGKTVRVGRSGLFSLVENSHLLSDEWRINLAGDE